MSASASTALVIGVVVVGTSVLVTPAPPGSWPIGCPGRSPRTVRWVWDGPSARQRAWVVLDDQAHHCARRLTSATLATGCRGRVPRNPDRGVPPRPRGPGHLPT